MKASLLAIALVGAALVTAFSHGRAQSAPAELRIGTYDSRAVAGAYAASRFNPVAAKMKELEAAKAAHDQHKVAELEAWGPAFQKALHRQGFGRVPVDDLLSQVRDRLPEAARKAGVQAIVFASDWNAESVQVVDVTSEVVELFEPTERTLATIAELRKTAPLGLDELEANEGKH